MGRTISSKGLNLIKHYEGCYLTAYLCPANVWTIGYGHTGKVDGAKITSGMKISNTKANQLLKVDLHGFERIVTKLVKVPINQNLFDALVSFSFNVGAGALENSTLLKELNAGKYKSAAKHFLDWNKATVNGKKVVLNGLTKRRQSEMELFLSNVDVVTPSDEDTLTPKSSEGKIAWLQHRLNKKLSKNMSLTGIWTKTLEKSVITFKDKNGLDRNNNSNRSTRVGNKMILLLKSK